MITQIGAVEPALDMVSIFGPWGPLNPPFAYGGSPASQAYEAAGRTVWFPLFIPTSCTIKRFWWVNGATVTGGSTVKMGLYTSSGFKPGAKLGTEATVTQGTLNQLQFQAPTGGDFSVGAGSYWLGFYSSSATNTTFFRQSVGTSYNASLKYQEAAVLPATATPIEPNSGDMWVCGFSTTTLT